MFVFSIDFRIIILFLLWPCDILSYILCLFESYEVGDSGGIYLRNNDVSNYFHQNNKDLMVL